MSYYGLGVVMSDEFFAGENAEYQRNAWALYDEGFLFLYWMGGPLGAPVP